MLLHYDRKNVTQSERDTIKYLYDELEKMRPNLAQLATETEDNDNSIGEIIQAIEQSEKIINQYKRIVESNVDSDRNRDTNLVNIDFDEHQKQASLGAGGGDDSFLLSNSSSLGSQSGSKPAVVKDPLKELEDLFLTDNKLTPRNDPSSLLNDLIGNTAPTASNQASNSTNLIDMNLVNLNFKTPASNHFNPLAPLPSQSIRPAPQMFQQPPSHQQQPLGANKTQNPKLKALSDLDELGRNMLEMNLSQTANTPTGPGTVTAFPDASSLNGLLNDTPKLSLNDIQQIKLDKQLKDSIINRLQSIEQQSSPQQPPQATSSVYESAVFNSLNELTVKLESIKPDLKIAPLNLYDANNVKVVLHFAREPAIPGINVVVVSVTSTNTEHELKNFSFQAAVPKVSCAGPLSLSAISRDMPSNVYIFSSQSMKVKLQLASRNDLPTYNPILPPSAITQIMLVANPTQVRLLTALERHPADNMSVLLVF